MEILFRNQNIERLFNSERELRRTYGARMTRTILTRLGALARADTLAMIPHTPPERLHLLAGRRQFQYAVDLAHPYRLIFSPAHTPVPLKADGGIDLTQVTAITIIEVIDYH